ncbi:MAG: efflux RND transporter periplasmic adaptor subunit [Burkholderiaceae bacterium]|jgi:RND family efflux transporter MFP subunit|nr:efflux RND transporter periplasmic adaptor subunit [Burkholderiaceae bacterium]
MLFSCVRSRWPVPFVLGLLMGASTAATAAEIRLDAAQAQRLDVRTETVQPAQGIPLDRLPAEIVVPLETSRTVSAPFAGIVSSVAVDEGAAVKAGALLARVQSRDFLAAQADLRRSRSDATLAQSQSQRDAMLLDEGIIARARADETRARAADAQARLAQARAALAGIAPVRDGAAGEYALRAPITGRVLRRAVAPGQVVGAFDPVFVLAADARVDVQFQVPVAQRNALAPGLVLEMADGVQGRVVTVASTADPVSQSLRLRARLPESAHWRVGERTTVRLLLSAPQGAVRVPLSALLADGARTLVFVASPAANGGRQYRAVPVERLGADAREAVVRGALKAGEAVVARGASALKPLMAQ